MKIDPGIIASAACALLFVACNAGAKYSLEPGRGWVMVVVSVLAVAAFLVFRQVCKVYGLTVAIGLVD